jgi:hypothetical protein
MKILYIAWSKQKHNDIYADPSVWYRCFQPAQAIRDLGFSANVVSSEIVTEEQIQSHDCIVFFRPVYSSEFVSLINLCEQKNKYYLASYDDLFFDIGHLRNSGFRKLGAPQSQILNERPELHAKAFYFFDNFISSTIGLKTAIQKHKPASTVITHHNGIPPELYAWARLLLKNKVESRTIGYFAGGAIHTPDLERIAPALSEVLIEQNATFLCVETVQIPQILLSTGKVELIARMNYTQMALAYNKCNLTIAPLEINEFTNSKSGIKFLESATMGNRVVATPIDDITRVGNNFLFPADSISDWQAQLKNALSFVPSEKERESNLESLVSLHSTRAEACGFLEELNTLEHAQK